jgi:hypothetical protein
LNYLMWCHLSGLYTADWDVWLSSEQGGSFVVFLLWRTSEKSQPRQSSE